LIKKNIYHFIAPFKENGNIVYNLCQEKNKRSLKNPSNPQQRPLITHLPAGRQGFQKKIKQISSIFKAFIIRVIVS